jgi:nucleoside-diphosphate-sugar epimerase
MAYMAIIGADGFVGRALINILSATGETCVALGRDDPLPTARFDVVIDCNGEGRRFWCNENPDGSYQRNVETVAAKLAALETETYVYISTVDVYGAGRGEQSTSREDVAIKVDVLDVYGRHKYEAERLVLERASRALVLRCGTLIGPGLKKNPVFDLLHDAPLRMTADSTLNLLRIETLGAVLMRLLQDGTTGVYNVAASRSMPVSQIRLMIAERRGINPNDMPEHPEQVEMFYDVNVDKLSAMIDVPASDAALHSFLQQDYAS